MLSLVFKGCDVCCPEQPPERSSQFFYFNKSPSDLMLVIMNGFRTTNIKSVLIVPNDTNRLWPDIDNTHNEVFLFTFSDIVDSVAIKFNSIPFKCFVYGGAVTDSAADIRVKSAYDLIETVDSNGDPLYKYYYTITEEHFNNSGECSDKVSE